MTQFKVQRDALDLSIDFCIQNSSMSLTARLLGIKLQPRSPRRTVLERVSEILVQRHGVPALGNFRNPLKEIFYILLSARTTDAQYRSTFRNLNREFPTLNDLSVAPIRRIRDCITSGGLATKRAAQIRRTAKILLSLDCINPSRYLRSLDSERAYETIVALPGMGPKSAFCVLMYSLDFDTFPVDINVQRIAERIGIIRSGLKHRDAQRVLAPIIPEGRSRELHISMVVHGRKICLPINPKCGECDLRDMCQFRKRIVRGTKTNGESRTKEKE